MSSQAQLKKPVRAGTFSTLSEADKAVDQLLKAGFTQEEITVVCSDKTIETHFQRFEHQDPAGAAAGKSVLAGTSIGAAIGGLTAIAFSAVTGTVPLLIAGAAGLSGGSAMGGFLGPMLTRGNEGELSNYYDQEVLAGKILVGVDVQGPRATARLAQAAQILTNAGAESVALPEG